MKKLISMSVLLGAVSAGMLSAAPSSAQTVVPIIGGTLNVRYDGIALIDRLGSSTLLTPIGTVSINNNGFNGNLTSNTVNTTAFTGSSGFLFDFTLVSNATSTLQFTGTTDGIAPITGAFTNAPTTINSTFTSANFATPGVYPSLIGGTITGGSITLPAPPPVVVVLPPVTCEGCLIVRPEDLLIANSTFLSPDSQEPEYRQEYKNDFSASSFSGGRILALEDK